MFRIRVVVADRESVDVNVVLGVGQIVELEVEFREYQVCGRQNSIVMYDIWLFILFRVFGRK